MRILVVTRHLLFLRFLEPVIRELLAAGHKIEVGYTSDIADDYRNSLVRDLADRIVIERVPPLRGWPRRLVLFLRLLQDYLRYLDPVYDDSPSLRARAAAPIPGPIRLALRLAGARGTARRWRLIGMLRQLDAAFPCAPAARDYLAQKSFDLMLVTPLVDPTSGECEYLKCAIGRGDRTALLVASWDNLTNKGLIQHQPDRVLVWNQDIAREAEDMHRIPPANIGITGAPVFDVWFDMHVRDERMAFCRNVGLDPDRPIVLYLCSSSFIAGREAAAIRRWLGQLRSHPDPQVSRANVLVRPHPANRQSWGWAADFDNVAVWPPQGEQVINDTSRSNYFDSLHHASVVVAVNTSGMLEAAIVGRPVLMLHDDDARGSQTGTLHFRHLIENGLIQPVDSETEHFTLLANLLAGRDPGKAGRDAFVRRFIRPPDLGRSAADVTARELERLATR